ncbi:hypothetical protein DASC09_037980 [Saccharomycopsis crataegensis]|uniref:Uncharacterized protein n=1 Tax=Saccharomycopsis crataegensis TaxID=43959 RepID=A0AAV5QNW5_9ASCO|nr:hypothetical protein DASC09_037980 [Saccharomycopsis crataegensis]
MSVSSSSSDDDIVLVPNYSQKNRVNSKRRYSTAPTASADTGKVSYNEGQSQKNSHDSKKKTSKHFDPINLILGANSSNSRNSPRTSFLAKKTDSNMIKSDRKSLTPSKRRSIMKSSRSGGVLSASKNKVFSDSSDDDETTHSSANISGEIEMDNKKKKPSEGKRTSTKGTFNQEHSLISTPKPKSKSAAPGSRVKSSRNKSNKIMSVEIKPDNSTGSRKDDSSDDDNSDVMEISASEMDDVMEMINRDMNIITHKDLSEDSEDEILNFRYKGKKQILGDGSGDRKAQVIAIDSESEDGDSEDSVSEDSDSEDSESEDREGEGNSSENAEKDETESEANTRKRKSTRIESQQKKKLRMRQESLSKAPINKSRRYSTTRKSSDDESYISSSKNTKQDNPIKVNQEKEDKNFENMIETLKTDKDQEAQKEFDDMDDNEKLTRLHALVEQSKKFSQYMADRLLESALEKQRKEKEEEEEEESKKESTNKGENNDVEQDNTISRRTRRGNRGRSRKKPLQMYKDDKEILNETKITKQQITSAQKVSRDQPKLVTGAVMRDYQLEGLEWLVTLYKNGLNGILADEMGLGKTIQSLSLLAYLYENGNKGPFLIACPLSTVGNWIKEIEKFIPSVPHISYVGTKETREEIRKKYFTKQKRNNIGIVVTSYEMIIKDFRSLNRFTWKFLIVDEGHRLKNVNSKLIRELKKLDTNNRLLLTGTPLQNNLDELWSLLNFILPDIFSNIELFHSWFDFSNLDGDNNSEAINAEIQKSLIDNLHTILQPFLLRRLKKLVVKSLPPKREYIVYNSLTDRQTKLYQAALTKNLKSYLVESCFYEFMEVNGYSKRFSKEELDEFFKYKQPPADTKNKSLSVDMLDNNFSVGDTNTGKRRAKRLASNKANYQDIGFKEFEGDLSYSDVNITDPEEEIKDTENKNKEKKEKNPKKEKKQKNASEKLLKDADGFIIPEIPPDMQISFQLQVPIDSLETKMPKLKTLKSKFESRYPIENHVNGKPNEVQQGPTDEFAYMRNFHRSEQPLVGSFYSEHEIRIKNLATIIKLWISEFRQKESKKLYLKATFSGAPVLFEPPVKFDVPVDPKPISTEVFLNLSRKMADPATCKEEKLRIYWILKNSDHYYKFAQKHNADLDHDYKKYLRIYSVLMRLSSADRILVAHNIISGDTKPDFALNSQAPNIGQSEIDNLKTPSSLGARPTQMNPQQYHHSFIDQHQHQHQQHKYLSAQNHRAVDQTSNIPVQTSNNLIYQHQHQQQKYLPAQNHRAVDQISNIPVQTSNIPVQTSNIPVQTSNNLIYQHQHQQQKYLPAQNHRAVDQISNIPVQTSNIPVQTSNIPVQTSNIPVQTSNNLTYQHQHQQQKYLPAQNYRAVDQTSNIPVQTSNNLIYQHQHQQQKYLPAQNHRAVDQISNIPVQTHNITNQRQSYPTPALTQQNVAKSPTQSTFESHKTLPKAYQDIGEKKKSGDSMAISSSDAKIPLSILKQNGNKSESKCKVKSVKNIEDAEAQSESKQVTVKDNDSIGKDIIQIKDDGDIVEIKDGEDDENIVEIRNNGKNVDDVKISFDFSQPKYGELENAWSFVNREISQKPLGNLMMQLRLICDSPYLFFFPWETDDLIDNRLVENSGKMQMLDQLMDNLLNKEKSSNHKILIFSQFTKMLDLLQDWLDYKNLKCSRLDGSVSQEIREVEINNFNNNPEYKVFLLSTRAGGLGINLVSADTVVLFDSDWNPQVDLQAMDRVHRLGQTKPVLVYRFATVNTAEQILLSRADSKRKLEKVVIQMGKFESLKKLANENTKKSATTSTTVAVELSKLLKENSFEGQDINNNNLSDEELRELLNRDKEAYQKTSCVMKHLELFETSSSTELTS